VISSVEFSSGQLRMRNSRIVIVGLSVSGRISERSAVRARSGMFLATFMVRPIGILAIEVQNKIGMSTCV